MTFKIQLWLCFYLSASIALAEDYFDLEPGYEGVYEPTFTLEELQQMKLPHSTSNDVDYDICKAGRSKSLLESLFSCFLNFKGGFPTDSFFLYLADIKDWDIATSWEIQEEIEDEDIHAEPERY